jgi:hypothetical protein
MLNHWFVCHFFITFFMSGLQTVNGIDAYMEGNVSVV